MKNQPHYKLKGTYQDGSEDEPKLYKLDEIPNDWPILISRNSFICNASVLIGTAISLPFLTSFSSMGSNTNTIEDYSKDILAHNGKIYALCFSPDGKNIVSVGQTNKIKIWDFPSALLNKTLYTSIQTFRDCNFDASNSFFYINSNSNISLYKLPNFKKITDLPIKNYISADYSNNLNGVFIKDNDGKIFIYDLKSNKAKHIIDSFLSKENDPISISTSLKYIVKGSLNELILYEFPFKISDLHKNIIICEKGRFLLSFSENQIDKIWELPFGKIIKTIKFKNHFSLLKISPNGKYIALGNKSKITIIQVSNDKKIVLDNASELSCLDFSPDGNYLASASETGTIKIWAIPSFTYFTSLFDKSILPKNEKVNQYTSKDSFGQIITFTLPCGSPIPENAICVCNCVPGSACNCVGHRTCSCVGHSTSICTCNKVCTCVPIK